MSSEKRLVVVCGPTASGKTELAIRLAEHFRTAVVSADSRQFYKGMAIGTAQPTAEELARVPHYFIASNEVTDEISCGRYEREALEVLDDLFAANDTVILAGGSGLYINAVCYGMDDFPDPDPKIRKRVQEVLETEGHEKLAAWLRELDPQAYDIVDICNPRRVARAIEVTLQTGLPYSAQRTGKRTHRPFSIIKTAIDLPREVLYHRIEQRVDAMLSQGMLDEVRQLVPYRDLNALKTVGYRELFEHLDGNFTLEQAVEKIKTNTRRYAKRQLTWFRADREILWAGPADLEKIISHIERG